MLRVRPHGRSPKKLSNGRIRRRDSDRVGFVWEQFQCAFQKFVTECHGGLEIFPLIIGIHRTAFSRFDVQLLRELERTEYLLYLFQSIVLPQKVLDLLKAGIIGWNIYDRNAVRLTTLRSGWLRLRDRQIGQERAYHNNGRRRPPPTAHLTSPTLV